MTPLDQARTATTHAELRALMLDAVGLECVDLEDEDAGCTLEEARAAVIATLTED